MMKCFLVACLLGVVILCSTRTCRSWAIVPKVGGAVKKAASIATVATVVGTAPIVAGAAVDVDFSGSYADPFHQNCQRVIVVEKGSTVASLSGTDGNPACPPDGSGRPWKLTGKVDGDSILVDFRPKGGPPDLKGVWDASSPAGIKWPDGNKWTLKE